MNRVVYDAISYVLSFIEIAIFVRVIISWLPISRDNRFIYFLYQITEPILAPIRSLIYRSAFGRNMIFDFSPVIAFLLIRVVRNILLRILI